MAAWLVCSGGLRREDRRMLAVVGAFVAAYFFYYFSGGPDFGARYWFPIIVPLAALTARGIDKYHNYRGMRADIRALSDQHGFGPDLVLVRGLRFPDYASAFAQNPADLTSQATIYAWDRDPETRQRVIRAYQDRRVWLVDGPSITGSGYRLVEGPVQAPALLTPR